MTITHTPLEALEILVSDLNNTYWSSWQSTAKFSTALIAAEQVLKREQLRDAAPDLLSDLQEAAATLRRYETLHRAKGTEEGNEKAEVNARLASRFEATIAKATGGKA